MEFKFSEAPKSTKSTGIACTDLKLERLWVVHPGRHTYPVDEKIIMMPLDKIADITF